MLLQLPKLIYRCHKLPSFGSLPEKELGCTSVALSLIGSRFNASHNITLPNRGVKIGGDQDEASSNCW